MVCLESDYDFPFLELIKREKDARHKQELKILYSKVRNRKDARLRFLFKGTSMAAWMPLKSEIKLSYEMPLKLMKGYSDLKASLGYGSL